MEDLALKILDAGRMYLSVLELPVEEEGVAGFKKADAGLFCGGSMGFWLQFALAFYFSLP